MRFLVTNDDGYEAPGLAALREALQAHGQTVVVAPRDHHSGCSHRATTDRGLELTAREPAGHALDGTPVDCVRVALTHLLCDVDWVLSGINAGGNLGCDVFHSGTVAAVREAALLGKPGIALSQYRRGGETDWKRAARWAEELIGRLLDSPPERGAFWNVNLPDVEDPPQGLPEVVHCEVDTSSLPVAYELRDGRLHYRGAYHDRERWSGRDVDVCFSGRIAVSQIHIR